MFHLTFGVSDWFNSYVGMRGEPLWFWYLAVGMVGVCVGSFLNVCIWRMPRGESIVTAPSHCPKCGHELAWYENIPLFSFLFLRCKCRKCHEPITWRYFVVEALTMVLLLAAFYKIGYRGQPVATIGVALVLLMLAIVSAFTDVKQRIIPNQITYFAMIAAMVLAGVFPEIWGLQTWYGAMLATVTSGAIAAVVFGGFTVLGRKLFAREAFGWGDVKFLTATAMLIGVLGMLFVVVIGSIAGIAYGVGLAVKRGKNWRRSAVPFGPFLAVAAVMWLLFDREILLGYLQVVKAVQKLF